MKAARRLRVLDLDLESSLDSQAIDHEVVACSTESAVDRIISRQILADQSGQPWCVVQTAQFPEIDK